MAEETLCVGIDLGCDTLKLSYAYSSGEKNAYGKLEKKGGIKQVAIPAVAYYDGESGWIFGSDVEMGAEKPFVNVVKIKSLLSLLYPKAQKSAKTGKEVYPNQRYYYEENHFPKFYFPVTKRTLEDFPEMIKSDRTFRAEGYTPRTVCEKFFGYVGKIIREAVDDLRKQKKRAFTGMKISLVHPLQAGSKYVEELCDLVYATFGVRPCKVMDSARALSMFAMFRGEVKDDEGILLFDMGEETISVVKCFLNGEKKVVVEAFTDHSDPLAIGGNDVDFNIAEYIEESIRDRETVGSPSAGESGHIQEEGLQTKQYLFMKEIKKAKFILSIPDMNDVFGDGVPVSLHRDLYIQRTLTREQLLRSVGITGNSKVAKRVLQYIVEECERAVNDDVSKIFLTGGLTETYGLVDYLKKQLAVYKPGISVCTFDDDVNDGDRFTIQTYEDSVYAPSVGAALVALNNYDVSAGLTYSYGTYVSCFTAEEDSKGNLIRTADGGRRASDSRRVLLEIFADRGTAYDDKKTAVFSTQGSITVYGGEREEFFSVRLSESSIAARKCSDEVDYCRQLKGDKSYLFIDQPGTSRRKRVEKKFQLTDLFASETKIICRYDGREIEKVEGGVKIREGIRIRPNKAVAEPFIENISPSGQKSRIIYKNGAEAVAETCKIAVEFSEGANKINVEKS